MKKIKGPKGVTFFINLVTGLPEQFSPMSWDVTSDSDKNKKYIVQNPRPYFWSCTCNAFRYNTRDHDGYKKRGNLGKCKHILKIREETGKL